MLSRYHACHAISIVGFLILAACNAGGLLVVTQIDGGGGAEPDGGTDGASVCHPHQDDDPTLCAGKCDTTDDGCGGIIYCDAVCPTSTSAAPATCGYAMSDAPACDPCTPDSSVMCPADKPVGWSCLWHPIQSPCVDMGKVGDSYKGCCGGVS